MHILVMAGITYLLRMVPLAFFRKKISSPYLRSMLYYLPYAILSAMVIPAVFNSTGSTITAAVGLTASLLLAFFRRSLVTVALGASVAAYFADLIIHLFS